MSGIDMVDADVMDDVDEPSVLERWGWIVLTALISLVIAFSAIRGWASGYTPAGDNALLELRARDVFTEYHPLLGTGSSASISTGIDLNHPGPLLFDIMALPIKWFGESAGIAMSIALLNIVAVCAAGIVVARTLGGRAALVTQTATAGLAWTMGSELLYDLWQPNVLVLSFWVVLCSVWAVAAGHIRWLPLAVVFGSLAMQTHLSYILLVPILLVFCVGRVAWRARGTDDRIDLLRRPLLISVGVILVLWSQPLIEQFFGDGQGNLSRVVIAGTGGGDGEVVESTTTGVSLGLRILAAVVALPPWWGRQGYDDSIPSSTFLSTPDGPVIVVEGLPSLATALIGLAAVCIVVGAAWWWSRRINPLAAGFQTFAVAAGVATVTAIITPVDILGLSPHKLRWLWVVAAMVTALIALAAIEQLRDRQRNVGLGVIGAAGLVAVLATLPTYASKSGPMESRHLFDSISALRDQVEEYIDANPEQTAQVVFDADGIGFAEPYTSPIIAELAASCVDFVVPGESFLRQVDEGRRMDDAERVTIFVRVGEAALFQPGATRIAFHDGELTNWTPYDITDRAVGVFLVEATP